jgi:RHS repeat-associated protein
VVFDPWRRETWDVNDTVLQDDPKNDEDVGNFFQRLRDEEYLPTWHGARKNSLLGAAEKSAADKTEAHANTPSIAYLDTLGRTFLTIADNGLDENGAEQKYETRVEMDIEGNERIITDARGNRVMEYAYSIQGPEEDEEDEDEEDEDIEEDEEEQEQADSRRIYQKSMDAGERRMLYNVAGNPIRTWDSRDHEFTYSYDELQRPTISHVKGGDGDTPLDNVFEKIVYGDWKGMTSTERDQGKENNLIGKPKEHYDTAGKIEFENYDFKGNLKKSTRRLAKDYKNVVDWGGTDPDDLLESEPFTSENEYDALNRVTQSKTPDGSIIEPGYNEANLLDKVDVTQNGATRPFVKNIDYNEKVQRTGITYGNDVATTYEYDEETFRLTHLQTKRENNTLLQDLYYTYDPTGNITCIEDKSIPVVFFNNQKIEGVSDYTYDPIYRLIKASGREHATQANFGQVDNFKDLPFLKKYSQGDPMIWRNYTQSYKYDGVGNIEQMKHTANGGGWTRDYDYENSNNRLTSTTVGSNTYTYHHHLQHGFMDSMPHLPIMKWNFKDQLHATSKRLVTNGNNPETTYYAYDTDGQRVRKITERQNGTCKNERIYLGGFEIYREYQANGIDVKLERETLHIMDEENRIALVESLTRGNDGSPDKLTRYQLSNHLGTACLETDDSVAAHVISYEEYHSYGTTSYQATDKDTKAAAKRYRYTGKERDEESGLNYHGARYYASWLGRWVSVDPVEKQNNETKYTYVGNNPLIFTDPRGKKRMRAKDFKSDWQLVYNYKPTGKPTGHKVYILHSYSGDPTNQWLRADLKAMSENISLLQKKGYEVELNIYATEYDFEIAAYDQKTVGIVWTGHGTSYTGTTSYTGNIEDIQKIQIKPTAINPKKVSKILKFVVLGGCGTGVKGKEWKKAFGNPKLVTWSGYLAGEKFRDFLKTDKNEAYDLLTRHGGSTKWELKHLILRLSRKKTPRKTPKLTLPILIRDAPMKSVKTCDAISMEGSCPPPPW